MANYTSEVRPGVAHWSNENCRFELEQDGNQLGCMLWSGTTFSKLFTPN